MLILLLRLIRSLSLCLLLLGGVVPGAWAEVNPEIANCEEIKDEATQTQVDFCSAHIGCRLVLSIQKTCAKVKSFIDRIKDQVGEGTQTLFGKRRTVDAEQVFEAAKSVSNDSPTYTALASSAKWQPLAAGAQASRRSMSKDSLQTPSSSSDTRAIYEEAGDGGKRVISFNRQGDEVVMIARHTGTTPPYANVGPWEYVSTGGVVALYGRMGGDAADETRTLSKLKEGDIIDGAFITDAGRASQGVNGYRGRYLRKDGTVFEGRFDRDMAQGVVRRIEGAEYGANGKKIEEGQYRDNQLAEGRRYGPDGRVTSVVKVLSDERLAAQAKVDRERAESARLAQEQQQRELKAKQEAEARIARMNPGELFAYADELTSQGKPDEARKMYRTLLSRYPNHPLAANAAQALSASANAAPAANMAQGGMEAAPSAQNAPRGNCDQLLARQEQEFLALNRRELSGMTDNLERVMWMTSQRLQILDASCPGNNKYAQMRTELKAAFEQARQACSQVSTGPCTAQPH